MEQKGAINMAVKLQFPVGTLSLTDIDGEVHLPDSDGQILVADLPQHQDIGQLLRFGYTVISA